MTTHRVVIVGGGFAGLSVARGLRRSPVEITLIDRQNYHLFQPLLYQVATGGLSPANIATPLRSILKRQRNTTVLLGEVCGLEPNRKVIQLGSNREPPAFSTGQASRQEIAYDTLVVATGARHHYFGNHQFEQHAPGLKSIQDATAIRTRILAAFEAAERCDSADERARWLTFVVVGAGPTGLELAGTIAELARQTLPDEFRRYDTAAAKVLLVEGQSRVLPNYPSKLSDSATTQLERIGVTVQTSTIVQRIESEQVVLQQGDQLQPVHSQCVFWAAGVKASPLAEQIALACDTEVDRAGRLAIEPDCSLANFPQLFVLGDMSTLTAADGSQLPGTAAVASQQGKHVARQIRRQLQGNPTKPFVYRDLGQMATIGRSSAVCHLGKLQFGGYPAWLTWLFLHLILLVGHENRILVSLQWFWNYWTRNRSARLITEPFPPANTPTIDSSSASTISS